MPAPLQDERARLSARYREMTDLELTELAETGYSLTEIARTVLQSEISLRRLDCSLQSVPQTGPGHVSVTPFELVTIRSFRDLVPAHVAKSVLDDARIDCYLADENTIRINWFWSYALGCVKLRVRKEDVAEAEEILSRNLPELPEGTEESRE